MYTLQALLLLTSLSFSPLQDEGGAPEQLEEEPLTVDHLRSAMRLAAIEFTEDELKQMLETAQRQIDSIEDMRNFPVTNADAPSNVFIPIRTTAPPLPELKAIGLSEVERPEDLSELYYADIPTLAALIKGRKVSCVEPCPATGRGEGSGLGGGNGADVAGSARIKKQFSP